MTNAIGTGTRNITINVPTDEREFWGELAKKCGQSIGEVKRSLSLRGLEVADPQAAARLREIRRQYYGAALLFLCLYSIASSWLGADRVEVRRSNVVRSQVVRRAGRLDFEFVEAAI